MPPRDFSNIQNNLDPVKVPDEKLDAIKPEVTGEAVSSNTLKTFRSYASDMATAIKDKQGSVMKIAMAEKDRRDEEASLKNPVSKKNIIYTISAILLVVLAGGALYFGVLAKKAPTNIDETPKDTSSSFVPGDMRFVEGTSQGAIQQAIQNLTSESHALGSITILSFVGPDAPQGLSAETFFEINSFELSSQLKRSLEDMFSYGVYTFDGNTPFLIFKADSYDSAYIGMLALEKNMYSDATPLFLLPEKDSNESVFALESFVDSVIANKDVRGVKNITGEHIFFYGIQDDGTIIVTTSADAYKKLLTLLQ